MAALALAIDHSLSILKEENISGGYIQFGKQRLIFGSINPPEVNSKLVIPISSDNDKELLLTLHNNALCRYISNTSSMRTAMQPQTFIEPINRTFSPYVIGPNTAFATGLATVFSQYTPQQAIQQTNKISGYTLIIVSKSGKTQVSKLAEKIMIIPKSQQTSK